jgi:hypothetical protein
MIFAVGSSPAQEPVPGANQNPEYVKLRQAQPAETFLVENIILQRDIGTIALRQGTISFTPPVLGRVTVGVFVGSGEFSLVPGAAVEKRISSRSSKARPSGKSSIAPFSALRMKHTPKCAGMRGQRRRSPAPRGC